jgi:hypothetical protein
VTGAVKISPTRKVEIMGAIKNRYSAGLELSGKFDPFKGKICSFLNGDYLSLTRGLLMGDPKCK